MGSRLDQLKEGGAGCPSDLRLERLVAGELDAEARARLEAHVAGCARCGERVALRRRGFEAFAEADPRKMLAAIRRGADAGRGWAGWRRLAAWAAPLVVAGLVVALWRRPVAPETPVPPADTTVAPPATRMKGELALHVFRQLGDGAERLVSGGKAHAGDRLRFAVDLPRAGRVSIVGVERSGELFAVWPLAAGVDTARAAGAAQMLPGAVALDDTRGKETLYLVECAAAPACRSSGAGHAPACGDGCALSPFVLDKDP